MPSSVGYPTLSSRVMTDEELRTFRAVCDKHQFSYGVFSAIIVQDIIASEELTQKYVSKMQQFEDDQKPANMAEMKTLRETLRQQAEELEQLRAFKQAQLLSLNSSH